MKKLYAGVQEWIGRPIWLLVMGLILVSGLLIGCSGVNPPDAADTDDDAPVVDNSPDFAVSATGEVVPLKKATLSFTSAGRMVTLNVDVGTEVKAGDVIAELDTTLLDAELERAEATVRIANAQLAQTKADPRSQQVSELEQNVTAASAAVASAIAERDRVRASISDLEITQAKVDVQRAFIGAMAARAQRDYIRDVLNNHDKYDPFDIEYYFTEDLYDDKHEAYQVAYDNLIASQAYLDELLDGPNPDEIAVAEAEVWAAAAEYLAEKARLELLQAGAAIPDINVAQVAVNQAEAALDVAKANREKAVLRAPFDGVVTEVYLQKHQYTNIGQPIVLLADLSELRVETTDLNEIDVAALTEGSEVQVTFDALPDGTYTGSVVRINPRAEEGAGVNFTVIIKFEENIPEQIRWGMTAFVDVPG